MRTRIPALSAAVVLTALAIVMPPRLDTPQVRAQTNSPDQLLQLAERLLGASPPLSGPLLLQPQPVQLLPGALPADLPLTLPMPPSSTLIGSAERPTVSNALSISAPGFQSTAAQSQSGERTDVVIDATQSPADVIVFYQSAMGSMGWSAPPQIGPAGLVPTPLGDVNSATFCQSPSGPLLTVDASTPDSGPTDVRVEVATGGAVGQCNSRRPEGPAFLPPGIDLIPLIPNLRAPDGVTVQAMNGANGGGGRYGSDALATTDMSAADLASAYSSQLQAAGWRQLDGAESGTFAWSTWTISTHTDALGFFYVRQGPPAGTLLVHVEVASTDSGTYAQSNGVGVSVGATQSVGPGAPPATTTPAPAATVTPAAGP